MRKVKIKAPSKINLTLDVSPLKDGYHPIVSLVSTIDVCDEITLIKRKDDKITLKEKGLLLDCAEQENNAVKTARAFQEKYGTCGVDIILNKKIPVGAGVGGSSADIAGVINGMQKLFGEKEGVKEISNSLASDATYLIRGGFAVISDRGNTVKELAVDKTFYLLLITRDEQISAKESYKAFDMLGKETPCATYQAVNYLISGEDEKFFSILFNGLYEPSLTIIPALKEGIDDLKDTGAKASLMTGSGSAVYGIYQTKKERDRAYKGLYKKYGKRLIKTKTL